MFGTERVEADLDSLHAHMPMSTFLKAKENNYLSIGLQNWKMFATKKPTTCYVLKIFGIQDIRIIYVSFAFLCTGTVL